MTRSLAEISLLKTPKDEGTESTAIADIDIVMNHHLQEIRYKRSLQVKWERKGGAVAEKDGIALGHNING